MSLICVVPQVDKDLRVMLVKPDAPAPKTVAFTLWKRAIPQFNIHHLDDVMVRSMGLCITAEACASLTYLLQCLKHQDIIQWLHITRGQCA